MIYALVQSSCHGRKGGSRAAGTALRCRLLFFFVGYLLRRIIQHWATIISKSFCSVIF
jgi:hypothetical protein